MKKGTAENFCYCFLVVGHSPLWPQIKISCPNLTRMVASIAPVFAFLR